MGVEGERGGAAVCDCCTPWTFRLPFFYIFTSENITFSKYAFYFINNSLYFITLYIIKNICNIVTRKKNRKNNI